MTISLKTHKMLWGRAASRCSLCKMELVMDASETDDPSVVGEACHIAAESPDGPRGTADLAPEQRNKYANLILLCNVHHKLVDDQTSVYPVHRLEQIKADHEQWVREQLRLDTGRQREDEIYAGYVEEWAARLRLDEWRRWASALISHGQPSLDGDMKQSLDELRPWLLSRVWPGRYQELEDALLSFRLVLQDLCLVFGRHASRLPDGSWETEKFYRLREWDPERYRALSDDFDRHVDLVGDLALELTRAANYVCDRVRQFLVASYRITEGVILIEGGPYMDLSFKTYRVEYRGEERTARPYPGLDSFMTVRFTRDVYFGSPKSAQQQDED